MQGLDSQQVTLRQHPGFDGLTRRQLKWIGVQVQRLYGKHYYGKHYSGRCLHEEEVMPVLAFCDAYINGIIETEACEAAILHLGLTEGGVKELESYVTDLTDRGLGYDACAVEDALPVDLRHPIYGLEDVPSA